LELRTNIGIDTAGRFPPNAVSSFRRHLCPVDPHPAIRFPTDLMSETMLAGVLHRAKDLRVQQVARPELRPGMVLLRVRRAGICGSDMHYFEHGCCGAFVPSRPFILGHEFTAEVAAAAGDVPAPVVGTRVTVNPARACGFCDYCKAGRGNLCRQTIMLGSGSTTPPTDGAFAEFVTVRADQCHVLPPQLDDAIGAMMEPFAVALQAVKRAGSVAGKRVLVTGGGPIGLLVLLTARAFGATPVVLSDVVAGRRETALTLGADAVLDPAASDLPERLADLTGDGFDAIFEASGAPAALRQAFDLVRPGGTIVQIGTLGTDDVPLPANQLMVRETQFIGSFRYGNVFGEAIRLAATGRVNLDPLVSQVFPLVELPLAMHRAFAKDDVIKVQVQVS
jgi:2-desacetyl-2-hydroxyethyl bacteriochlorophyllide A dehydrogenase